MRYRIKLTTFQDGRKEYVAQVKLWFTHYRLVSWLNLNLNGDVEVWSSGVCEEQEIALLRIDKHFRKNAPVQKKEFQYVEMKHLFNGETQ